MIPSSTLVPLIEGSGCTTGCTLFSTSTSLLISPYSSHTKGFASSHLQTPSTKNRYWIAPKGHINVCGTENVTGETEYRIQIAGQWALVQQICTTTVSCSNRLLTIERNQTITCEHHNWQNSQITRVWIWYRCAMLCPRITLIDEKAKHQIYKSIVNMSNISCFYQLMGLKNILKFKIVVWYMQK
jgi:hypothetical protein